VLRSCASNVLGSCASNVLAGFAFNVLGDFAPTCWALRLNVLDGYASNVRVEA